MPKQITTSFMKTHPDAKLINWSRANGTYIATFQENNSTLWSTYDEKGLLLENKWKVSMNELPFIITDSIKEKDINKDVAYYKTTNANGLIRYEIKTPDKKTVFSSNGQAISTTEKIKR